MALISRGLEEICSERLSEMFSKGLHSQSPDQSKRAMMMMDKSVIYTKRAMCQFCRQLLHIIIFYCLYCLEIEVVFFCLTVMLGMYPMESLLDKTLVFYVRPSHHHWKKHRQL